MREIDESAMISKTIGKDGVTVWGREIKYNRIGGRSCRAARRLETETEGRRGDTE
jgi:hypothetical protein